MKTRAEHFFIGKPAFPLLQPEEPSRVTIGAEPADIGQQPWPDYPTYWDVSCAYLREWVIPKRCDLARTTAALFRTMRAPGWDPHRDARTFKRADGRAFVNMRRADGVADGTIRRDLVMAAAVFSHGFKNEILPKKPKFDMPAQSQPRNRFLTGEEVSRLLRVEKPERRQLFWQIAIETGVRSKAIEEVKWSQVDMASRVIDFRTPGKDHKNKRRPIAPINDRLYPILVAARAAWTAKGSADPFVIGRGCTTYQGCKDDLKAIGIDERGVCRHVARHTFCSWRVQRGVSYAIVGKLVGDNASMIEKVYGHLSPEHLREASNIDARPPEDK